MPGAPRMSSSAYVTMGIGATGAGLPPRGATVEIGCWTMDMADTDFGPWICLGDAFSWSPGTVAIPPAQSPSGAPCGGEPRAELWYVAECGLIASCGACRAPATVSFVVEDVGGGAAPPPALVTADYRRTFRVELLMPNPVVGQDERQSGVCGTGVSITGSVHFASTPADFVYEPDHVLRVAARARQASTGYASKEHYSRGPIVFRDEGRRMDHQSAQRHTASRPAV